MNDEKITHIDLFSGIGGGAFAADQVWGEGKINHIFCDNEPFAQQVLKKNWPEAPIVGDIRTFTADTNIERYVYGKSKKQSAEINNQTLGEFIASAGSPFILTGGFPCQPFSNAGRRKGTADDRHIWPEMLRVIREFKPQWVIGENVAGLLTWDEGVVLEQVCLDLEGEGYEVQPFIIPAVAVNAPHRRDRVWIVANSKISNARQFRFSGPRREGEIASQDGFGLRDELSGSNKDASDARCFGSAEQEQQTARNEQYSWNRNWIEVATELCGVDDGLPAELDGLKLSKSRHRADRLKGLGNAWVPQVAIQIFEAIKEIDERTLSIKN